MSRVLDGVNGAVEPPQGAATEQGVLTIVGGSDAGRVRQLPAIFFGPERVFAHRNLDEVVRRVSVWVDAATRSSNESIYTLTACRFRDVFGLYGVDAFNRSRYRRDLARLGVEFPADPFVRFVGEGAFACEDWGVFSPRFVALGGADDSRDQVFRPKGAELAFVLASYRMGALQPDELRELVHAASRLDAVSAGSASALVTALNLR